MPSAMSEHKLSLPLVCWSFTALLGRWRTLGWRSGAGGQGAEQSALGAQGVTNRWEGPLALAWAKGRMPPVGAWRRLHSWVSGQGAVPSAGGDSEVQKNVTVSKERKRGLACLTGEAGLGSHVALGWPSLAL